VKALSNPRNQLKRYIDYNVLFYEYVLPSTVLSRMNLQLTRLTIVIDNRGGFKIKTQENPAIDDNPCDNSASVALFTKNSEASMCNK